MVLSWQVYFPDIERCEWLNRVLKQVWPNANHYAKALLKDSIEPNVQKALSGFKLNNFKFDRMVLGTIVSIYWSIWIYLIVNISRNYFDFRGKLNSFLIYFNSEQIATKASLIKKIPKPS